MKCDNYKKDYKNEFLKKIKVEQEVVWICNNCEEKVKEVEEG